MKKITAIFLSVMLLLAEIPIFTALGENEPMWQFLEGEETAITETGNGVFTAQTENGGSHIITTEAYDAREKEISFKADAAFRNVNWYSFGVVGESGEHGAFGSMENRVDIVMHTSSDGGTAYTFDYPDVATLFGQHGCGDFTQTHTFGFVKKGFQWYFKVDGKILNETITDPDLNDLLNNNSKVKFVIGADNAYKLTDIKLMDNDYSAWFASSGEPAISENADGTYKFTGNGEIASSEFYNLADYELAFQSAPSGGKGLRVGVSKFDDEGTLLQKALYLQIGDGNCEIGWFGDEGYVAGITTAVISSEQQHSFGVKKRGDIYYPVIDGTTVFFPQTDEWQKRQLEFSDFVKSQDGILGFTFSSENGLDLDRVELRACGEDWVKHKCYGPEGSNITILGNADGYTLSAEGTASFLTMDTYDLSTDALSFKFITLPAKSWAHLSIASAAAVDTVGGVLQYEEVPTRVDFLFYQAEQRCILQFLGSDGNVVSDAEYGSVNFDNITHTFGLIKQEDNWYPVIDGVVQTQKSDYLNEFMSNNDVTRLRLGIGACHTDSAAFAVENVKVVSNTALWEKAWGADDSNAANTSDTVTELYYGGTPSKYQTISSYDVTTKDFTFEAPEMGEQWIYVGVGSEKENQGLFVRISNNEQGIGFMKDPDSTSARVVLDGVEIRVLSPDEKHSFGIRERDGKYYPAIDGKIVEASNDSQTAAFDGFSEFIKNNGSNLKFVFYAEQWDTRFAIKSAEIINANLLWQANTGSNLMISVDDSGSYSAKGISRISTVNKYDLTEYDVSCKMSTEKIDGGWLYFAISEQGAANDALLTSSADWESTERIELIVAFNGDFVSLVNANYNDTSIHSGKYGLSRNLVDLSLPHTYGVRKSGDHWYFAVDGQILNTDVISERLDDFMNNKGPNFYITIGMGGHPYTAEQIKLVTREEYGDWLVKSGGGEIGKAEDGTYYLDNFKGSVITKDAYNITQYDVAFNVSEYTGDWIRFGLAAGDEVVSANIAYKELISRFGETFYISYLVDVGEDTIAIRKYDLNVKHTFGVRKLDGHWYPAVDGEILNQKINAAFDQLVEANKDKGMRFILGSHESLSASEIEIIPSVESKVRDVGWDYIGYDNQEIIYGELAGNEEDGYEMQVTSGRNFAFSNAKYDLTKTSLSFDLEDVGEFLYFGVSTVGASTNPEVLPNKDIEIPDLCAFIFRPSDGHREVTVGYWSPNHEGVEVQFRSIDIDWFTSHTIDIRNVEGNWFVCLDGIIMQNKISQVFNAFMQKYEGQNMHYVIGSLTPGLNLHNIKVIDQVPLAYADESELYEDGTLDDNTDVDYGFDFSDDTNIDTDFGDFDFGLTQDDDNTWDEIELGDDSSVTSSDSETDKTVTARVKKRQLVSAGHGWIFTKLEIAAMIAGGVVVLAGLTVAVIFTVRAIKKKKRKNAEQ